MPLPLFTQVGHEALEPWIARDAVEASITFEQRITWKAVGSGLFHPRHGLARPAKQRVGCSDVVSGVVKVNECSRPIGSRHIDIMLSLPWLIACCKKDRIHTCDEPAIIIL